MPEDVKKVRVFVASPGDVMSEKAQLSKVVQEINITHGQYKGFVLELVEWKTHSYPSMGRPQGVINQQIGPYDIFVGIMWKRFGSPTGEAESGTEEEFRNAYATWEQVGKPHISFYFCQAPSAPPKTPEELEQLSKVLKFHNEVSEKGLVYEYLDHDGFANDVRPHLIHILNRLFPSLSIKDENAIKELVQDVFDKNFVRLQAVAQEEAQRRIDLLKKRISEEVVTKLSNDKLIVFGEPDVQYALFEAIKAGARTDSKMLRDTLSSLLIERVKRNDNDLQKIVYNEAISTLGKLTRNQLDILALRLIVDQKVNTIEGFVVDWSGYLEDLERLIKPFLDCKISHADLRHLQYSSCAYAGHYEEPLIKKLRKYIPLLFQKPIAEQVIASLDLSPNVASEIFSQIQVPNDGSGASYIFNPDGYSDLDEKFSENRLKVMFYDDLNAKQILGIRTVLKRAMIPEEVVNSRLPESIKALAKHWHGDIRAMVLTSVGLVLAVSHIEQGSEITFDVSEWFS